MRNNILLRLSSFLVIVFLLFSVISITASAASATDRTPEESTFEELNGKTISMLTGAPFEELISSKIPDVKEFTYYSTSSDIRMSRNLHIIQHHQTWFLR